MAKRKATQASKPEDKKEFVFSAYCIDCRQKMFSDYDITVCANCGSQTITVTNSKKLTTKTYVRGRLV